AKYVLVRSHSRISKSAWNSVCQRCRRKLNSSCLCASSLSRHRYRLSLPATAKFSPSRNDGQKAAWCRTIEAFDEAGQDPRQIALFPEDRLAPVLDCDVVHVRLSASR